MDELFTQVNTSNIYFAKKKHPENSAYRRPLHTVLRYGIGGSGIKDFFM